MTHDQNTWKALAILLIVLLTIECLSVCANAYLNATTYPCDEPSVYDLWNISSAEKHLIAVKDHLLNNGWVSEKVSIDELDYICCMATQLSSQYDDLSPGLVLAMIAVESRFDTNALSSGGARGLMQLIPHYHEDRLSQFLEDGERYSRDLFYEPLYNIMTGMDYLHERLNEAETNLPYALMQYNQGPSSAYRTYVKKGVTSKYAIQVIELSVELDSIFES